MRKPDPPCSVCRRLGCTDPRHKRVPFDGAKRKQPRPNYHSAEQIKRRRETVAAFIHEHGFPLTDGAIGARCPDCRQVRTAFVADHVTPLARCGSEDGPLRVHCRKCSSAQGAMLANESMRKGDRGRG